MKNSVSSLNVLIRDSTLASSSFLISNDFGTEKIGSTSERLVSSHGDANVLEICTFSFFLVMSRPNMLRSSPVVMVFNSLFCIFKTGSKAFRPYLSMSDSANSPSPSPFTPLLALFLLAC
ncbi:hypothetical protein OGAPHI_006637 [Ogataea philodendri]|uniref:Uncharacterized protein n=1 Tax=Ogataea philodendri TaxID=1378263 RepID=A0A9P8NWV8_9ASCO|nr:uncharacterized protein OGAPHI_006637 [Ogataea philodendri]KAH3661230.1 hypothetical protein OGAPHI_006637 [Ogataea philodendri]